MNIIWLLIIIIIIAFNIAFGRRIDGLYYYGCDYMNGAIYKYKYVPGRRLVGSSVVVTVVVAPLDPMELVASEIALNA